MNSIAQVRASLARLVDRHLAAGLASEGVYIASGATLLRGVSSDLANGNVDALERLAAGHAALEDDRPRLVYADWLTEQGSTMGEFITLSRAGQSKAADKLREIAASALGPLRI